MGQKRCCLIGWGGPTGSALSGRRRSTLWSHKGLHWSLEIANKKDGLCVCVCEQELTERFHQFLPHGFDSLFFVFVMNPSWRTFFGKRKYIYTHVTPKHYLLHWSSMIPINIQLQKRQCSGHRDGTHGQKKKNTYQSYRVRKCFKTFSLFGLLKTCSFFLSSSFFYLNARRWHYGEKALRCLPFFFFPMHSLLDPTLLSTQRRWRKTVSYQPPRSRVSTCDGSSSCPPEDSCEDIPNHVRVTQRRPRQLLGHKLHRLLSVLWFLYLLVLLVQGDLRQVWTQVGA